MQSTSNYNLLRANYDWVNLILSKIESHDDMFSLSELAKRGDEQYNKFKSLMYRFSNQGLVDCQKVRQGTQLKNKYRFTEKIVGVYEQKPELFEVEFEDENVVNNKKQCKCVA